ncbi:MAG: hypothetical protein OXI71_01940 [Gemmatimonadota bacterium]|nr:hypothetical protein [Gemmatimonadota bacterium]
MAVTINADALGTAIGADATTAARLLRVASEIVTRYAPDAPDAIQDEAVIRVAGWLRDSPSAGILQRRVGEREYALHRPTLTSALRSSGAMSLLRPYRSVGAGVCG